MLYHILGWATVAVTGGVTAASVRWLYRTARYPWPYLHKPRVPKIDEFHMDSGTDYVGVC